MTAYRYLCMLQVVNLFLFGSMLYAESDDSQELKCSDEKKEDGSPSKEAKPPAIGNFALPTSQQPAALFGFGGNIIDKGEVQFYFFADRFTGRKRLTVDLIPNVVFGVTDEFSIYFGFPFTNGFRDGKDYSSGFEDFLLQFEYAFYNKSTNTYVNQATVLGTLVFPTGSAKKSPPTGFGATSFFVGSTFYHTRVDWFFFMAPGAFLTGSERGTKFGNQFLYQFGLGRNVPSPKGWIYALLLELDGQYNQRNRIHGHIDKNSGGNALYLTPSIWMSNKNVLLQFGASVPLNQNLFGKQRKFNYALNLNLAWSFY